MDRGMSNSNVKVEKVNQIDLNCSSFPIYNCASGNLYRKSIEQMLGIGITSACKEMAMEQTVWVANGSVTLSETLNLIRTLVYQVLPAFFIDQIMKFKNMKPR